MNNSIRDLMKYINDYGYECYIIGGYVRDYLLNIVSTDYDLCTNAPLDILKVMLNKYNIKEINYGTIVILLGSLVVEITTYRREIKYYKRKPIEFEFVNTLAQDIERRDFTINTICLDCNNNIIDLMSGREDLNRKIIKCVGDVLEKLQQDPLRILRAIRFSAYLNFDIDKQLEDGIKRYKYLLSELSYERKKEEINKLIKIRRLDILIKYNLTEYLELDLSDYTYYDSNILVWIQIDKFNKYITNRKDKKIKNMVKELMSLGLTPYNIYKYGLDISLLVGELNKIDVISIYNSLPIKCRKDINISIDDIISIVKDVRLINNIYKDLEFKIINHEIDNDYDTIMSYLKEKRHTI